MTRSPIARDLTFWLAKTACARAIGFFWRGHGCFLAQADFLTPTKAQADLSAWPAKINFDEKAK